MSFHPDVKIFVSTHKKVNSFDSSILQLVQVGSASAGEKFLGILHDDNGENISALNNQYCELTTQYWAWKNVEADYYGFCHYRRYFNFSDAKYSENDYGDVIADCITKDSQQKYGLDDKQILDVVSGCDVLSTINKDLRKFPTKGSTPYDHYAEAPYLHIEDLDLMVAVLSELYPDYKADAEAYLTGNFSCFCNMFIMKKDIFFRYSEWLFAILEEVRKRMDVSHYSVEGLRTLGHLAERLFNIFMIHCKRENKDIQWKQAQCVVFNYPEAIRIERPHFQEKRDVAVPVAFAANDEYVPMLATTLYSMLKNASNSYNYDIIVLHVDISEENQNSLKEFFASFTNSCIRFINVQRILEDHLLETNNPHISVETYYRFLVQDFFSEYKKAIYLDSDLIVKGDISQLFSVEMGGCALAATCDIECLGNLNRRNSDRFNYVKNVLRMRDPYKYFQAGVLVFNLDVMRKLHSIDEWLSIAANTSYKYNDQDILNKACEGKVKYLDCAWNVMTDCNNRYSDIFSFAPAEVYQDFKRSLMKEKIVHYAGFEKPWKMEQCDRSALFWTYAKETPFFPILLKQLIASKSSSKTIRKAVKKASVILPEGSRRRRIAKAAYFRITK